MTIFFNEGLPGSGKSLDAMEKHIVPALQKGREVWAYIEGMDHAKIAEVAGIQLDVCQRLLHQVTREEVPTIHSLVSNNSLVVLDEAQNFWPTGRQRLDEATTQFITEHRHRGLDILLMGQLMKNVHALWRGRVQTVVVFNKLIAVGAEKRYRFVVKSAVGPEKFSEVNSGIAKYNEAYFGTYKSHVDETVNTANYKDARASLLNAQWLRYGVPVVLVLLLWGGYTAWGFFHQAPKTAAPQPAQLSAQPAAAAQRTAAQPAPEKRKTRDPAKDFVGALNDHYRPRLAMYWSQGGPPDGVIEWYDGDTLREQLTFREVRTLGAEVTVMGGVAKVAGDFVTAWKLRSHEVQSPQLNASPISVSLPSL